MKTKFFFLFQILLIFNLAKAQNHLRVIVKDSVTKEALPGVSIILSPTKIGGTTNENGTLILNTIPVGTDKIQCTYIGYTSKNSSLSIPTDTSILILMSPEANTIEEITISATRTNARMDETPMKVEVLGAEETQEENAIKPSNVASLLGDISGIQIQQSSSVSGNSNVRIQGLGGKYTQILRDGLPLYDGFSGGFGIMQIPPLDLKQIEIIKGTASTLYGGGAIGGIINLVSKEPREKPEGIITLNQSTLSESNLNSYYSVRKNKLGVAIFAGTTNQNPIDVNKDGFTDVPKIQNIVVHPRLFFYFSPQKTLSLGFSSTYEKRKGGDLQTFKNNSDSLHPFFEQNTTSRNTADITFTQIASNKNIFTTKGSVSFFDRNFLSNTYNFRGTQTNGYGEISYLIPREKNDFVIGINVWQTSFQKSKNTVSLLNDFSQNTVGAFAQNTWKKNKKLFIEEGIRADYHSKYGLFVLPRIAALYKFNEHWYSRAGFGLGYLTPNSLTPQNTETHLEKTLPIENSTKPEKSSGTNLEINYKKRIGEKIFLFINHAFFYTQINHPIITTTNTIGITSFENKTKPITSTGWDTYIRMNREEWNIYLGYTYTLAKQKYNPNQTYLTLTPRNRAATVIAYEIEGKWRFGIEGSYTGFQYRDDGTKTPNYVFLAAMIEKKFKHVSLVLNGENLLDERQTSHESIVIPPTMNPTFKPLWGPIEGRVINLSLVVRF